jgi:hypothetical protein
MTVYYSDDDGRTWKKIEVRPTSLVALALAGNDESYVYDDGYGNLYTRERRA